MFNIIFSDLLALIKGQVTRSNGHVQNGSVLANSGMQVICSYKNSKIDVTVYQDGSVCYKLKNGNGKWRCTVLDIRKAERFCNSRGLDLYDEDAFWAVMTYGDNRIFANMESETRKYTIPLENSDSQKNDFYSNSILNDIVEKETMKELITEYEKLSPVHKEILYLYFSKKMTEEEISEILGVPRTTVASRKKVAIQKLGTVKKYFN